MATPLKILHYDVETTPLDVWAWRPMQGWIPHDALKEESYFLSWAAKWDGQSTVYSDRLTGAEAKARNDKRIVASLRDLLEDADILVAHNGDSFDWPRVNGRLLLHGLDPIPPPRTIDTLKLARKNFDFAYNKLDYLAKLFGLGAKIRTEFEWWVEAMEGHEPTLRKMERYNKQDVRLLEDVFWKMYPYVRNLPRLIDADREMEHACPSCGSSDLMKRGKARTNASNFQRWQCNRCGRYSRSRSADKLTKTKYHPL